MRNCSRVLNWIRNRIHKRNRDRRDDKSLTENHNSSSIRNHIRNHAGNQLKPHQAPYREAVQDSYVVCHSVAVRFLRFGGASFLFWHFGNGSIAIIQCNATPIPMSRHKTYCGSLWCYLKGIYKMVKICRKIFKTKFTIK